MNREAKEFSEIMGFPPLEAAIYIALARQGPSQVSTLSRAIEAPRMTIYAPLEALTKRGLVSVIPRGKRKYYTALPPRKLGMVLERKKTELERLFASSLVGDSISAPSQKLAIQFFPGSSGIATAGQIFLDETREKTWYSFENPMPLAELVSFEFQDYYVRERVRQGIHSKMIISSDISHNWLEEHLQNDKKELRETLRISAHEFPFDSVVAATKGLVIIINERESPFAVLIRNSFIANTLINIHSIIWGRHKPG